MNPLRFSKHSKFKRIFLGSIGITLGLICTLVFVLQFPFQTSHIRYLITVVILALLLLNLAVSYYILNFVYRPIRTLIRETEETLQGLRQGDISLVRDDEIGILANNFNQIILDAQMKRMELETSNQELASHAEIIKKTYRELDKKVYDLFTLFNIGKELNSTLSMDSILKITCFTSMGQLGVTNLTLMLLERTDSTKMLTVYEKGLRAKSGDSTALNMGEEFAKLLHVTEQPVSVAELENRPEFKRELAFFEPIKTALITPLTVKKNVIGILLLGKKLSGEDFSQGEKEFVSTLASLAAIALENARLYELAITDTLTKLFLKRYFQLRLDDELKRADRYHGRVSLIMIDIDHFKRVNDTYGHPKGDEVLAGIAKDIKESFRDVDVPARYGGEEFSILLPEVSKEDGMVAAERLRKRVESTPRLLGGKQVTITISLGIAEFPKDAGNSMELVEAADAALYRSKEGGRNRTTLA